MKECRRCHVWKPLDAFPKDRSRAGGVYYYCRECLAENYKQNREKIRARQNRYAAESPEKEQARRERFNATHPDYQREWRQANLDKARRTAAASVARNKDKIRERKRRYLHDHLDQHRVNQANRRARKRAAGGRLTHTEWLAIVERFGGRCAYCRESTKLTIDHVVAISKGGRHEASNIVPACLPCNLKKQNYQVKVGNQFTLWHIKEALATYGPSSP